MDCTCSNRSPTWICPSMAAGERETRLWTVSAPVASDRKFMPTPPVDRRVRQHDNLQTIEQTLQGRCARGARYQKRDEQELLTRPAVAEWLRDLVAAQHRPLGPEWHPAGCHSMCPTVKCVQPSKNKIQPSQDGSHCLFWPSPNSVINVSTLQHSVINVSAHQHQTKSKHQTISYTYT